mmetsp:Transcript_14226/g.38566  ORF Transcript_14226/g.38566 Transcript_14226/m.38566 type:complete len:906 (-) Transcript_14226:247-2964(-)|eukprot:CAMPEP_0202342826 /NCGR_PEP_ID=MMETSP1126-20121109/3223_1 /ASSEMBLY_ACC=CAM_ASM_000457 /TAXON_ID=3047 /ORGANISM="Dunaliella tertiolecta, Strain CCMP1320" /LENGTH=905 /DNA_ID=CAMNT_0048933835 /DNA_START=59 /DNA_END=2776 /DNA_ORIENTATION=-
MSLFTTRTYWEAKSGSASEEYDGNCLCVANVDNDETGQVKIVTGSLQGMLRVYHPTGRQFKPDDLLLEQELDQAILQLEAGRFSSYGGTQLAVLHPRSLVVYNLKNVGSSFLHITKLYAHHLDHTAANMTYGPFGGIRGIDYICVQSYDGQLSVFECEAFAFSRFLPGFLIPGPLAYIEPSDSIVTSNAALELECYKFKTLADATGEQPSPPKSKEDGGGEESQNGKTLGLHAGKRLQADWKRVLGENAIDIRSGFLSQGTSREAHMCDIIVLCEHHVFLMSSATGAITFQKRLDYHPACCTPYPAPEAQLPGGPENLLVASHNHGLHVYRTTMLCWAARTLSQPIALRVADFVSADNSQDGGGAGKYLRAMLVMLDESGLLSVNYLGTDAMANSLGWGEGKEVDYEDMMQEQKQLAAIIQAHSSGQQLQAPDRMVMRAQVPRLCDHARAGVTGMTGGFGSSDQDDEEDGERMSPSGKHWGSASSNRLTTKLYLYYQGAGSIVDNVSLVVRPPKPLKVDQESILLRTVGADPERPTTLSLVFSLQAPPPSAAPPLPSSCTAQAAATFEAPGSSGQPRGQHVDMVLPLSLFTTLVPPVKSAVFKITVSVNRPPPLLSTIFDDMLASLPSGVPQASVSGPGANVLSFQFASGHDVTVLVSKNAGRYRLQSDTLEAMWMIMSELVRRLTLYYEEAEAMSAAPEGPLAVTFEEPLPLEDFFEVVEAHFAARLRTRDLREQLGKQAMLFRTIQKQLLIKFRDKAPAALNDLDVLMEETYQALSSTSSEMEAAQEELQASSQKLACVVQLILLLIQYKFQLQPEEVSLLQAALSPEVHDNEDVGWEEITEASMTQLLRSCLARNAKEASVTASPLTPARDTSRLRKHISLVLERLAKGMRLTGTGPEVTPS